MVFAEGFPSLMKRLSGLAVREVLLVPIVGAINDASHYVPLPSLAMIIVALDDFPDNLLGAIAMFGVPF